MRILVTGGAGYIGSVVVKQLVEKGHSVVVTDNLSRGKKELVNEKAEFFLMDMLEADKLNKLFAENSFDAVMHFAAYKAAGESMKDAVKYSANIQCIINILNSMVKHNVKRIIFSSSAAVYGVSGSSILTEEAETDPMNFYGFTKLEMERIIEWYHKIHGISYIALRYFNVVGDGGLKYIDPDPLNIFPIIIETIKGTRDKLTIYGNDYDTPDGTCVRDYIHVIDLANAHILALDSEFIGALNLGTGEGFSVKELVDEFLKHAEFEWEYGERREGDPARLVASFDKAKEVLGWEPKLGIKEMIQNTIDAYS